MSEKKYFCFCSSNCKYETMTKEQILAAIAQAAETGLVIDPDSGFITKVKETNAGGYISFWVGTQAQYNALKEKDHKHCMYIITDCASAAELTQAVKDLKAHAANKENPHGVTAAQIGAAPAGSVWTATDPNNDGNIVLQYGGIVEDGGTGGTVPVGGLTAKEVQTMIDAALAAEDELTEEEVQSMIDASLGVIENGTY